MTNSEKVMFSMDGNEKTEFYILEQTSINGNNYLLVTDSEDDEAEAYILKEIGSDDKLTTTTYEMADGDELMSVAKIFEELLEDVEFR